MYVRVYVCMCVCVYMCMCVCGMVWLSLVGTYNKISYKTSKNFQGPARECNKQAINAKN